MIHYINVTGWVLGVCPTLMAFLFLWLNRGQPWRVSNCFVALLLIGISIFMLGLLTEMLAAVEAMHDDKQIADGIFKEIKRSGIIWLTMLPALAGGVGVNIFSDFLTSKKP